jgi:hypothetical protein
VQVLYILGHPFAFLQTILKDLAANGLLYLTGWINGYGYFYWTPPPILSFLFLLALAVVLFTDSTTEPLSKYVRVVLLLVFVAGYLSTVVSLYISFTPVGSNQVFGVQGRYFLPLMLPLFLAISSLLPGTKFAVLAQKWGIRFLLFALSLNLLGIFLSFHVACGSTFYQTGLCYRPLFRDFPSEVRASRPASSGTSLSQEIQVACDGLAEVRLFLTPSRPGSQEMTRFLLKDSSSGRTLLDTSIANGPLAAEDWYPLRFEPDWDSAGKGYTLTVLSATDEPLPLLYTPQPEFNLGNSYENGKLLEEDLVLQYGCVTGLRKLWLTGKP